MSVVVAERLGFAYGGRRRRAPPALAGVELHCAAGEILALLGPNGAGKSTLLQILGARLAPDSGSLRLFGAPPSASPRLLRRIGFAGDVAVHLDALSGRQNALFFAGAAGLDRAAAAAAVDRLFERFDLERAADRPVASYSFGMRRKLLLVGALVHEPALLLLDEPTMGLDPTAREELRTLLRERAREGAAIALSTHDVADAARTADRVCLLHRGAVALDGSPDALLRHLRGVTYVDVLTAAPSPVPELTGVEILAAEPGRIRLRTSGGSAILPELCATLVAAGAEIRAIHLREADLGDVFAAATGVALEAATEPA
ncbi:MAG TPA: ABC transporter ATP-binding protein [Longimicrobiales bacterium]|nr:ABC transporter ATP-binding protein [Longimicrobiales bacterium]